MMKPLSLTIRWWHWVAIALVLFPSALITTGYALRSMGRAHYQKTVDDLKSQGKIASVDDLIAAAPVVDIALQDDWDAWQNTFIGSGSSSGVDLTIALTKHQSTWDHWVLGRGPKPQEVEAILATNAGNHAAAIRMLRQGGLVLSTFGWIEQDLPVGKRRMPFAAAVRLPQLLAVRELAVWLRHATVLAEDPRQHLSDLDALLSSMQRPVTLIDAMIAISVARIRDRTYGDLALLDRLPDEDRQRWLAEPSRPLLLVSEALAGENVLTGMSLAVMLDEVPVSELVGGLSSWKRISDSVGIWTYGHSDCALMIEMETHASQRLRGERADWSDWNYILNSRCGPLGRICVPNFTESAITALQADAHHRMARLAVRVIALGRTGELPADQPALITALAALDDLAPTGDHLRVRYEVPAPGCFRLVIDPRSPLPNFDDPGRMKLRTKSAGTPPAKEPLLWSDYGPGNTGVIEIQFSPIPTAP